MAGGWDRRRKLNIHGSMLQNTNGRVNKCKFVFTEICWMVWVWCSWWKVKNQGCHSSSTSFILFTQLNPWLTLESIIPTHPSSWPIRGQYPGHVITIDQSEVIPPPSTRMPTRTSGSTQSGLIIPWRGFLSRISQSLIHQPMTVCSTQIGVRDKCILMQSGVRDKCILTQSVVRDACILTQSRVRDKCILTPEWSERQMYIDADAEWSERRMYIDAG